MEAAIISFAIFSKKVFPACFLADFKSHFIAKFIDLYNLDNHVKKINESIYLVDLLNSLESFALYFVSKVASEEVGFVTAGKTYCELVEELLPLTIDEFHDGYYKNTSILFITWNNRLTKEKLEIQKAELERKLANAPATRVIKPIGTE